MYSSQLLRERKLRYQPNIEWNLQNAIMSRLLPNERAAVERALFEFPLRDTRDPFTFLAGRDPKRIRVSVASIKFLDDVTLAWAWLDNNGYTLETLLDYFTLLKYKRADFAGTSLPDPLTALHVPADATQDAVVDDGAQKGLKSAALFVLAHELGHLYYGHDGDPNADAVAAQRAEQEADAFAIEIFRRMGVMPLGIAQLFTAAVYMLPNRADFPSDTAWLTWVRARSSHPLSGSRLRAIADTISARPCDFLREQGRCANSMALAQRATHDLRALGQYLDDPDLQRYARMRAAGLSVAALAPRLKVSGR